MRACVVLLCDPRPLLTLLDTLTLNKAQVNLINEKFFMKDDDEDDSEDDDDKIFEKPFLALKII